MGIKSHAFGRVTLTGQDAKKFKNQAVYGKATPAAKAGVKRGVTLVRALSKSGGSLALDSASGKWVVRK